MSSPPPSCLLMTLNLLAIAAHTAMALPRPRAYIPAVGVRDEIRASAYGDVFHTSGRDSRYFFNHPDCRVDNIKTCRYTGQCKLENAGFVCCCGFSCENGRRSVVKDSKAYICGDDGVTYPSYCEYKRQQCIQNKEIAITKKGPCTEHEVKTCKNESIQIRLRASDGSLSPDYHVPECDPINETMYKVTQCNKDSNGLKCWCVLPENNEQITEPVYVENDTDKIRMRRTCEQELKITKLSCDPCEVIQRVYKTFPGVKDYSKYVEDEMNDARSRTDKPTAVADKLFRQLDTNRDARLSEAELQLIARWLRMARTCLLDTFNICDEDGDKHLSGKEWCSCLMNRFTCPEPGTPRHLKC